MVEVGQELALGPCAVVLEEHTHGFLVHAGFVVLVESLQVVHAQGSILGGGIKGQTRQAAGNVAQFYATEEHFAIVGQQSHLLLALGIGLLQFGQDGTVACLACLVLGIPVAYVLLYLLLLSHDVQVLHGLVHAYGVLPVVAAACPLAGVLDGNGTVLVHPVLPYVLLGGTHIDDGLVGGLGALHDAP